MGGLWVDCRPPCPGLRHRLGEANFSDHGANRLGASALMQGLAGGYFPYTVGDYLADDIRTGPDGHRPAEFADAERNVRERLTNLVSIQGRTPVDGSTNVWAR